MKRLICTIILITGSLGSAFALDVVIHEQKEMSKDTPYPEELVTTIQVVCRNGQELLLIRTPKGMKIKRVYQKDLFTPVTCEEEYNGSI